ncbi:MAG: replication-associated recombination protein A [Tissierellia bacterium]|nr:replication-associated recombination protein A [Tissierellia bacterium]
MDLFTLGLEEKLKRNAPLADRMRPESIDEFIGQGHLIGKGKFLSRSIKADRITSMIFYGPPGTGKTTLAMIISKSTNMIFEKLSAVSSGVKDIREVISRAEENLKLYNRRTILFIDEIHRFNKSQQDALLPYVERGIVILIGATTENPYFEVNKALLSRVMVLRLEPLGREDLRMLIQRALKDEVKGLGRYKVQITQEAIDYLITVADGDGRTLLNSLEIGVLSTPEDEGGIIHLDLEAIKSSIQIKAVKYDKAGDEHYDTVSAFIKSMRGSDPDATLYWLAKMIEAGEDPKFIARRIIISASEDVGNADPNALNIAVSAFNAINIIGMPEGRIPLAQAALYIATAPKSNAVYMAIDRALEDIRKDEVGRVPIHLRDAHYAGAKNLGHGKGYKYPHDYEGAYVKQQYLPHEFKDRRYYIPTDYGFEKEIKKRMASLDKKYEVKGSGHEED